MKWSRGDILATLIVMAIGAVVVWYFNDIARFFGQ